MLRRLVARAWEAGRAKPMMWRAGAARASTRRGLRRGGRCGALPAGAAAPVQRGGWRRRPTAARTVLQWSIYLYNLGLVGSRVVTERLACGCQVMRVTTIRHVVGAECGRKRVEAEVGTDRECWVDGRSWAGPRVDSEPAWISRRMAFSAGAPLLPWAVCCDWCCCPWRDLRERDPSGALHEACERDQRPPGSDENPRAGSALEKFAPQRHAGSGIVRRGLELLRSYSVTPSPAAWLGGCLLVQNPIALPRP